MGELIDFRTGEILSNEPTVYLGDRKYRRSPRLVIDNEAESEAKQEYDVTKLDALSHVETLLSIAAHAEKSGKTILELDHETQEVYEKSRNDLFEILGIGYLNPEDVEEIREMLKGVEQLSNSSTATNLN
jgi:hypothetical protein